MLKQRLQAKAIRERMLRERRARPPERLNKEPEKPPDADAVEPVPAGP
jgi:hypothetical protein